MLCSVIIINIFNFKATIKNHAYLPISILNIDIHVLLRLLWALVRCTGCTVCTDCTDCTVCTDCTGCTGCTSCTVCTGCTPLPWGLNEIITMIVLYGMNTLSSKSHKNSDVNKRMYSMHQMYTETYLKQ